MKKMLSLVLALILCLTAVSAFAEAAPSPSLVDKAMDLAETVEVVEEEAVKVNVEEETEATASFVETVLEEIAKDIDEFFADVVPAEEGETLVLVATIPMSFELEEGGELPEEIKVASTIPENYPENDEGIKAIYTYLAEGAMASIAIDYEIEDGKIVYTFPANVLKEAEIGVMNFVKVVAE